MDLLKKIISPFLPFRSLFASGGKTFLYRIAGLFLNFIITFLLTRFYGDSVYGNYSLAFTLGQATSMLFALGLPNAIISYIGLKPITDHLSQYLLRKGLSILLIVAIIPFLVFAVGGTTIAVSVFNNVGLAPYIEILAVTVPVMILHEFILNFFVATGNTLKFNIFMFVVPNVIMMLQLLLLRAEEGYITLIYYTISIALVLTTELFFAVKAHEKKEVQLPAMEILKYSSPMMLSSLMLFLLNWTDVLMLGAMAGEKQVAYYNLAYRIASLSMLVIISMNVVLAPKVARLYQDGDFKQLHKVVAKTTHLVIALTLPVVAILIVFPGELLSFFEEDFEAGKTALVIISAGFLLNAITGNVDQILNMTGHQKILRNITIFGFLLNAGLNYIMIPVYGIDGSAMASLVTNVVFNSVCVFYIKKKLGFYTFV